MSIRLAVRANAPKVFPVQADRACTKLVALDSGGVPLISLDSGGSDVSVIVDGEGISWADETPVGTNPRAFFTWTQLTSVQVTYADATAPGGAVETTTPIA